MSPRPVFEICFIVRHDDHVYAVMTFEDAADNVVLAKLRYSLYTAPGCRELFERIVWRELQERLAALGLRVDKRGGAAYTKTADNGDEVALASRCVLH